ncbi:cytochrome P450 2B4-like isoform X1 [Crassostrea angulata]|uniref:cytochrome P450 2B4-like isoform X1 n=1 Tax=Magallana angulata TaxID=2784310 RepID=UPI0022B15198|nr:cytochrome P450 2B4-like isoform X1 [Crassostrea angulata]
MAWTNHILISFIIIALVYAYAAACAMWRTRYRLPPGPWAWPIIGNLPQLKGKEGFYHYVLEFRKTYGDIFRLKMGVHEVVFVFGHQHVQEVLCKNGALTSNRPNWMYIPNKIFKGKGIVWNNRDACKALRSVLKLAQEDSYVVASLQRYLATEFDVFQSHVKDKSSAYDLEYLIGQTSFNFLSAFLLGKRYSYDDPTMIEIRNKLAEFGASTASANPENYLPFLANFTQAKFQTAAANQEIVFNRFREIIQEKRNTPEDPPTDFLRIYLSNYEKEGLKNGTCEADLLQAVMDMFLAGKDNLLLSTKWILMALVKYPEVQSKCRSEIHQVIGQGQRVQSQDRSRTPYTVATIKEIQRLYSPVTFTVFHYPEQDIQVGGYDVPKDTLMMIECKAPCRDKQFWKDPEVFNPDRFLGIDGEGQLPEGCFIPYGEGPRYCIGKYVADMFMYFLVANIIQNFKITTRHPEQPLSFENAFSFFGLQPLHFPEIKLEPLE